MTRNPETTEAAREVGSLSPFGSLDPELVARMKAAIDSQIMPVRGTRNHDYAAQACAAVAQAAVLAVSPAVTEGERADGWYASRCNFPRCLLTMGHVAEHWPASPAVPAAEDGWRCPDCPHARGIHGVAGCPLLTCSCTTAPVVAAVPADPNEKD